MRILFVVHTFPPESNGGTELHAHDAARVLARDHSLRVFCRCADDDLPEGDVSRTEDEGFEVTWFNNLFTEYDSFEWTYKNPRVHAAFVAELESFRPDVVHIHHLTNLSVTIIEACKRRGLPVVFSLHDFWTVCPRGQRLAPDLRICEEIDRNKCYLCLAGIWPQWFSNRLLEPTVVDDRHRLSPANLAAFDHYMSYALDLCDLLLTPSRFHRDRMIESGLEPDRVVALHHGLDHERFHRRQRRGSVRVIGYIGSVIPPKGIRVLVEAFCQLRATDVELHVWGDAPPFHENHGYLAELQAIALGTDKTVRFRGGYDNERIGDILDGIDVLVVPSLWWETFSITMREAMLAGVPVIASDIGAMKEALDGTEAGLTFRCGDAHDLARVLGRLIRDRKLRGELSHGYRHVKTIERNAEEYLGLYDKAKRMARKRKGDIVVAPTSFP